MLTVIPRVDPKYVNTVHLLEGRQMPYTFVKERERSRGRSNGRWQDDITRKEGTTWNRKATYRGQWETVMEGYILQWMDKA